MRLIHIALIALGLVMLCYGAARADWQVHEWTGKAWEPAISPRGYRAAILIEKAACEMDLANLLMIKPDGTRLQCRQIQRPAPQP